MRAFGGVLAAVWLVSGCALFEGDDEPAKLADGARVEVVEVIKGDEIVVKRDGAQARVRMLGIQAFQDVVQEPELDTLVDKSKAYLQERIVGEEVTLHIGVPLRDSHGRYLAYVEHAGDDINRAMLRRGLAAVFTEYAAPREEAYLADEAEARAAKEGIWSEPLAVKIVRGLREQWDELRREKGEPLEDPWFAKPEGEKPAAEAP